MVVFQPHTYSRTNCCSIDFVAAFDAADLLVLTDIYAARETDTLGMDAAQLREPSPRVPARPPVKLVARSGGGAGAAGPQLRQGDVVLTLGAGTITELGPRLLAVLGEPGRLSSSRACRQRRSDEAPERVPRSKSPAPPEGTSAAISRGTRGTSCGDGSLRALAAD